MFERTIASPSFPPFIALNHNLECAKLKHKEQGNIMDPNQQENNQETKTENKLEEQLQSVDQEIEAEDLTTENKPTGKGRFKSKFWKSWTTKKKVAFLVSTFFGALLLFLLIVFFAVKPSKTSGYINNSWHDLVLNSTDLDRAISSEVNLAGTRDLADGLYDYNQRLGSASFEAKGKSSLWYNSGTTKEYSSVADCMRQYFSSAATTLAKSNEDITKITDEELDGLKDQGQHTKELIDGFRTKRKLQEDFNPSLFALDSYIREVKVGYEKIEKEKKEEEAKKAKEAADKAAKDTKDKTSVQSVSETYFKAFINGNEDGVRSTLSKGYQSEYDYASLKSDRRTDFYPKSHRIVAVDKDGDNYKVTASVTYVSRYTDSDGTQQEVVNPITMIYRVVFAADTQSWKIDGQLDR